MKTYPLLQSQLGIFLEWLQMPSNKSILKTDDRYSITILVQTNIHQTIDSWYVAYVVPKTVANKVHYCLAYD